MGMYSWVCSDTKNSLACYDIRKTENRTKKAFLLIPKEFGGGSFKVDHNYNGYGEFYDDNKKPHDVYEELAKWNGVSVADDVFKSRHNAIELYFNPIDKSKSQYEIGNYNGYETMKYPLKIVENECAYEDAEPCWDDRRQGC